jgi:hypothetical protein
LAGALQPAGIYEKPACRNIPRDEATRGSQPMNSETLLRFGLAIVIIGLGVFAYWFINQRLLVRASNNVFTLFKKLPNKPVLV